MTPTVSERIKNINVLDILKILFALVLFYYVFQKTTWSDLQHLWNEVSVCWLVLAALFFYLQSVMMGYRYWLLIDKQVPLGDHLSLVMLQIILGNLITPGVGIAAYMAVLKKRYDIRLLVGAKSIIWARLADLAILITLLGISIIIVKDQITALFPIALVLIIVTTAILVVIIFLVKKQKSFHSFIERQGNIEQKPFLKYLNNWLSRYSENGTNQSKASVSVIVGVTILIFLLNYLYFASLFLTFSLNPGIWALLFMLAIIQIINIIPIQFFGGLGVNEITYLYLLVLFGYTEIQVAPALIGMRVLSILFTAGLSLHILLHSLLERKFHDKCSKANLAAQK